MRRLLLLAAVLTITSGCGERERAAAPPEPLPSHPPAAAAPAETSVEPAAAPAVEPPAAPADRDAATVPPQVSNTAHDVTGSYFSMTPLPTDFAELDHLLLATIDENAAPAPLNGFLRPKGDRKDYTLVRPSIEGNALTFTTAVVDNVHYAFTGTFATLGKFSENPPDYETAILTGTLTRLRAGQPIASTPVKFRYEAGG